MKEYLSVSTIFDFAACLLYPSIAEDTRTQSTTAQVFPQSNPILSHSIPSPSIHNPHTPPLNLLNLQPPTLLTHNTLPTPLQPPDQKHDPHNSEERLRTHSASLANPDPASSAALATHLRTQAQAAPRSRTVVAWTDVEDDFRGEGYRYHIRTNTSAVAVGRSAVGAGAGESAVEGWKPRRHHRRRLLHRTTPPLAERHVALAGMIGTAIWESLHRGHTDIPAADVVAAAAGAEIVRRGTALRLRRVHTRSPRAETRVVDAGAERPGVCSWELRHRARSSTPAAGAEVAGLGLGFGAGRAVVAIRDVLAGELRAGSRRWRRRWRGRRVWCPLLVEGCAVAGLGCGRGGLVDGLW